MSRLQRFAVWALQPKVGLPLALLLCLAASPFAYRATRLAGLPDCGHPFDVEAFGTQDVPDAENAFVEYRQAAKLFKEMPPSIDDDAFYLAMDEGWSEASADVRKWVADNRACLEVWRRGTEKPDALNHQPKELTFDTLLPVVHASRDFGRLARLEGARLEEAGDLDAAWNWYLAMFRSSRHVGKRGLMIERLIGMAIHGIASRATETWARHDELTPDQLRRAIKDLNEAYAMTAPASVAYRCEYLSLENDIGRFPLSEFFDIRVGEIEFFLRNEPEVGRRVMRQAFANWLAEVDKPRHLRMPKTLGWYELNPKRLRHANLLHPKEIERHMESSIVARVFVPAVSYWDNAITLEQATQNALIAMLALRLHQLETGHLPATLDELVDAKILKSVPIDPWHPTGKPLQYRRKDGGAIVYGIGQDGVDGGGDLEFGIRGRPDIGFDIEPVKSNEKQ